MADVTEFNLGVAEYDCNTAFFQVIMKNLLLIDVSIAGLEGYSALNVPILIDSLISKTGKEKRPMLMAKKKELVEKHLVGITSKDDKDAAILNANIEALGYVVDHLFRYLNLETKLGVMES